MSTFRVCNLIPAVAVAVFVWVHDAVAQLRLPVLFGDHMVLQADREVAVWGRAAEGDSIKVAFLDQAGAVKAEAAATAEKDGNWLVKLPPLQAGTAGTLRIQNGKGEEKTVQDVLVGEVWLGSGQSNMGFKVAAAGEMEAARVEAAQSSGQIRYFQVDQKSNPTEPLAEVTGTWQVVTAENVGQMSAVSWYFARKLQAELHTPVGMIVSAWGGTPVEAWMSRQMLDATSAAPAVWRRHEELLAELTPEKVEKWKAEMDAWEKANPTPALQRANERNKPKPLYSVTHKKVPVALYNGMIHGLIPYALQGVIWYQGEDNAGRFQIYGELIQAMVKGWRKAWGTELSFYYVELAGYQAAQKKPSEGGWALIREAQAAVLELPKTGVATAVDLGLEKDIHPPFKRPVGERLAGMALQDVYGRDLDARSPQYAGLSVEGAKVRVKLDHAKGLRSTREDGKVQGFAIREANGEWKWADGVIENNEVVLWNAQVAWPEAVRYGWASFPVLALVNAADLPLRPFRTDSKSEHSAKPTTHASTTPADSRHVP